MSKTYEEKLNWLTRMFGHSFTDQIDDNREAIDHYYKATHDYDMGITDADDWAWLNTLFRYDIGADHANGIIEWFYENEEATVMDCVNVDEKKLLQNICETLGFHLDFSHWPDKEPKALEFGFKEYCEPKEPNPTKLLINLLGVLEVLIEAGATKEELEYLGYEDFIEEDEDEDII